MELIEMKICMIAYTFYETDNRVMRYAEEMLKCGNHVDVIALKKRGQVFYENIDGVNLFRIQEREIDEKGRLSYLFRILRFLLKSLWFVTKKHLRIHYDLIHVHSVPDFEVFAALIPKLMGAKIILDIHDIVPEFYDSKFNSGPNSIMFKLLVLVEKLSIEFSDHVIVSNHIWAKRLKSRSVSSEKCTTIINYPDNSIFYKHKITKTNDRVVIIYPGTINWHQGLDIAINAFTLIKDKIPNCDFHIYGEGPLKDSLVDLVKRRGLEQRVFINEFLPLKKIASVMSNADIGIIPKRNDSFGGEAFSTKTLEFMSLGVPIIVSRTKIDNYYFDESIVKFFEPENEQDLAESMMLLIKNSEFRETITSNALKFINKNTWDVKKHIYLDLVDLLVGIDKQKHYSI